MLKVIELILTFFNLGRIKYAPGTFASVFTVIVLYFLPIDNHLHLLLILFIGVLGFVSCYLYNKNYSQRDESFIVIDEILGMLIALYLLPKQILYYLVAFLLFRFFDILKPSIILKVEGSKYGTGIMLDDIISGIFAFAITYIIFFQ